MFLSCNKDKSAPTPSIPDVTFYALSDNLQLLKLNSKPPINIASSIAISNLPTNETLLSIDFRPATGQLYALGSTSRLYIINLNSGVASAVGTTSFTPAINGNSAVIDFNPTVDMLRVVSNTGQNLRLNPETGLVANIDGNISVTGANITAIAYTNNFSGGRSTEQFDIDLTNQKLYKQDPPNNGTLIEVGSLGVNFSGKAGFDINHNNSASLACLKVDGKSKLFSINTTNGKASYIADFNSNMIDIAMPTP